jgi:hypothetical protein
MRVRVACCGAFSSSSLDLVSTMLSHVVAICTGGASGLVREKENEMNGRL